MITASFRKCASDRARLLAASVATVFLLGAGCLTARLQVPGVLREDLPPDGVKVVGAFDAEHSHFYFVFGALTDAPEDLFATELKSAVAAANGDGIANVRFEAFTSPLDYLVGAVTLGFVVPRSYRMRGDIVTLGAAPLPGAVQSGPPQFEGDR